MREFAFVMALAAATTVLFVGPAGALAQRLNATPPQRVRDVHRYPIPRLGGLAMLAGVLTAFAAAVVLARLGRVFELSTDARGILLAALLICLIGAADDVWNLDAVTKLAGQGLAAAILVTQGVQLYWLPLPSGPLVLSAELSAALTVIVVLVTVNAVNFVDGLDGLAAGVAGIGALAFFAYSAYLSLALGLSSVTLPALVMVVVAGVCAGFLYANVHRARIFMGDSGSMLVGLLLAAGSIALTGQIDSQVVPRESVLPAILPIVLPLAVLAIPFTDLVLAIWRRTRSGRSVFAPDKQHLHHRLLDLGHSHRGAVAILWSWAALIGFGLTAIALIDASWPLRVVLVLGVTTVLVTVWLPRVIAVVRRRRPGMAGGPGPGTATTAPQAEMVGGSRVLAPASDGVEATAQGQVAVEPGEPLGAPGQRHPS